ncbi:tRNA-dihydrouridine synthase [Curtobacterium flaccumfaciens pv. flaccumfaciens]|nr:tRNA-dihydrouridine synthase [Curtobacterium flaccumfaciens pv. flaccumfaciens]MBO9057390.1 tRNA-dihydrouridine synthase [Curtobacterium flaccumfaciens pv. flaccumfaciens]QTR92572.1 tRNA-dihydrouridine synthase [Curtobacterium flaccumfaciens pv. flaccumfaciens]QVG67904.1 tRNA-dihydrouridine synthase [Curtobacterium flaccumfaciens pv. flaccumfaciens]
MFPFVSVRRRASRVVSIGVVAALAASLTGCGEGAGVDSDFAKICRDNATEKRLPDDDCNNHGGHAGWYFLPLFADRATRVPGVGDAVSGGTSALPAGKTAKAGVSSRGSSVTKGGFGGAGGHGGFGG